MLEEIHTLLDQYTAWLKDRSILREINNSIEITTPFLDRHNDHIQIFARRENGGFLLTDDSQTIHDLELSGCHLKTRKRQDLLNITLRGFGVKLHKDALEVMTSRENFPQRKHSLIQAMLAVNDLFYLAEPVVKSVFYEDVVAWLDLNDVRYTPKVKFTGTSGYDHLFDFVIPKSRREPERILRALNRPNRDTAEMFLHAWSDTREVRPSDSRAYAILNDTGADIPAGVTDALNTYKIRPVIWSHREEAKDELAA